MSKETDRYMILGERRWRSSLLFFFLIVFIFTRQFIPSLKEAISDPVYLFSVVMVSLAVAAPALWIFNEGRKLFSQAGKRSSSQTESELFLNLMDLPEEYRAFQNITIADRTFDTIIVGPRVVSVIGVYNDKYQRIKDGVDVLENSTRKKADSLRDHFEGRVFVDHILVKENTRKEEASVPNDHGSDRVIAPASLFKVLKRNNSGSGRRLKPDVLESLEGIWRGEG